MASFCLRYNNYYLWLTAKSLINFNTISTLLLTPFRLRPTFKCLKTAKLFLLEGGHDFINALIAVRGPWRNAGRLEPHRMRHGQLAVSLAGYAPYHQILYALWIQLLYHLAEVRRMTPAWPDASHAWPIRRPTMLLSLRLHFWASANVDRGETSSRLLLPNRWDLGHCMRLCWRQQQSRRRFIWGCIRHYAA